MKTLHLGPDGRERASLVVEKDERLLGEGSRIAVTVAEGRELLSPRQADPLGFSRQHAVRSIEAGELPGSSYWRIPLATGARVRGASGAGGGTSGCVRALA